MSNKQSNSNYRFSKRLKRKEVQCIDGTNPIFSMFIMGYKEMRTQRTDTFTYKENISKKEYVLFGDEQFSSQSFN
jgi:hypothetical protein